MKENKLSKEVTGTISLKNNGHAYLLMEEDDLFIHKKNLGIALDGDTVSASISIVDRKQGDEVQGIVKEVKDRKNLEFTGVIDINKEKGFSFVRTAGGNMPVDFYVPIEHLGGASNGDVVVVKLHRWHKKDKSPRGHVIKVLGKSDTHEAEMGAIMNKHNIDYDFPESVMKEAEAIPMEIPEKEILKRRDMRDTLTLTIDPETAKDFDDAISFKVLGNGNYEVGVHIADVTHYIRPGSELDKEALKRATSVYLVDRCIPMLPERLSNGICSLRPNEDKLTFSVIFEITAAGKVVKHNFKKTVINSDFRMSYEDAQKMIERTESLITTASPEAYVTWDLNFAVCELNRIAKLIRAERFKDGAVTFSRREPNFVLDDNNVPIDVFFHESADAHQLIEEYMLLANRYVATYAHGLTKPFVYRTHDLPDEEKLHELSLFVAQFGYTFNTSGSIEQTKASLNEMLKKAQGSGEETMISTLAIRSMSKAIYSTEVIGHYGLGFKHYSHFTSPIRRYPDVIAHRLLWEYVKGKNGNISKLRDNCDHCSEMENRAAKAQRESIKYKQCEYLSTKIGEKFVGTIAGVMDFGVFVMINENGCEGMIGKDYLTNENLFIDAENFCVKNSNNGDTYRLGDEVMIQVNRVNMTRKQIDFKIIIEDTSSDSQN
jgi:ribonuclease R